MKIAVLGWYGHNNAGDESIKYALSKFLLSLGGLSQVDFFDLHTSASNDKYVTLNDYDLVIIGGGGLILSQANYHDFIYNIKTKLITLGVSVEVSKLSGNTRKFTQALLEKSEAFLVRDVDSYNKIADLDVKKIVKVSYDLTFLEPFAETNKSAEKVIGINLLPKPKHFDYAQLYGTLTTFTLRQLARLGFNTLVRVEKFDAILKNLHSKYILQPIPLYSDVQSSKTADYLRNDVQFLEQYFSDVPQKFSHTLLDHCEALISMRLHGSIFAVHKGIPVVSLAYLPKNYAFMKSVGLEKYVIATQDTDKISCMLEEMINEKELIRFKMLEYKDKAVKTVRTDVETILNKVLG